MQATLRIASQEFKSMFVSPIAWLLLIVFIIQSGMYFIDNLSSVYQSQISGLVGGLPVTMKVFLGRQGLFSRIVTDLYLYIPLLTMGVISRELQSGSIKLLLSSPISISRIVLGKYLAIVAYGFILCMVLVGTIIWGYFAIESIEYTSALTAVLGVFLLICTYASIGLFMSTLSQLQVVVAIGTLAVLSFLNFIGSVGDDLTLLGEVTRWLSLPIRTAEFSMGLISTANIFYYFAIIAAFIAFSILKLTSGRVMETVRVKAGKYAFIAMVTVGFGYITSLPMTSFYFDMTANNRNSLSEASLAIFKNIEGPWKVTNYVNLGHMYAFQLGHAKDYYSHADVFKKYTRENPDFSMGKPVYYYAPINDPMISRMYAGKTDAKIIEHMAKKVGINPKEVSHISEIQASFDIAAEGLSFVRSIEWNGKVIPIRFFNDFSRNPGELEISTAFVQLLDKPQHIAAVTGHGERDAFSNKPYQLGTIMTNKTVRRSMINHGFIFSDLTLNAPVPADVDILLIADPKVAFSNDEIKNLNAYIEKGGNLMFSGELVNRNVQNAILAPLGIALGARELSQVDDDGDENIFIRTRLTKASKASGFRVGPIEETQPLVMDGAVSLEVTETKDFTITPIAVLPSDSTESQAEVTAITMTRNFQGHEQRIYISGDTEFWTNKELTRSKPIGLNHSHLVNLFRWVSDGQYPINIDFSSFKDKRLLIDRSDINWMKIMLYGIIPLLIGVFASQLLLRRRRR